MTRALFALLLLLPLGAPRAPEPTQREHRSPVALAADAEGRLVYVAESTANRVAVVDVRTDRVVRSIPLPRSPSDLLLDGSTLFVTDGTARGSVRVIDADTGEVKRQVAAGHMPRSPTLSPGGKTLYVLNRFENSVRFIDLATGDSTRRVALPREPIDAALTPDGETLIVLNHLPAGAATDEVVAAEASFVATSTARVVASVMLPNGSTGAREIRLSPDGRFAFCTHILARFHNPTTQLIRGWMNTNALSIIDVQRRRLYATVLLDDVDRGAANPWALAGSDDGEVLAVTHAGTHEVSLIDVPRLMKKLADLDVEARADVSASLSFLGDLRRRVPLEGNGPRAAVFAGTDLCVAEHFTCSLSIVEDAASLPDRIETRAVALGRAAPPDAARLGEMFFNDASLCFQNWQSCASCHPDSRADGLNWDLLNDGTGNPKNTKSLLLAHATPPAMITGIRDSAEAAVRAGVRHIQFAQRPESDMEALDAYLESMVPIPSPFLVDGGLTPAAERGWAVFERALCGECHGGPHHTDLRQYDLGMGRGQDAGRPLDTPTLVEVWRTAPYLHDGRAADLRSLLLDHNRDDAHGRTSTLSDEEIDDLLAYLRSL